MFDRLIGGGEAGEYSDEVPFSSFSQENPSP